MTSQRSKLEIYVDVLKTIGKGTRKPTRIMYRSNSSWKRLMKIFISLSDQGLITVIEEGSHKYYEITEKGKDVLQYFSRAMESIRVT